jgi:hypothetical protein
MDRDICTRMRSLDCGMFILRSGFSVQQLNRGRGLSQRALRGSGCEPRTVRGWGEEGAWPCVQGVRFGSLGSNLIASLRLALS